MFTSDSKAVEVFYLKEEGNRVGCLTGKVLICSES